MSTPDRSWRPSAFLRASMALHAAALVWAVVRPRDRWRILGLLALDHCLIAAAGSLPRAALLGPNVTRLPAEDEVFLTFDDGPDPDRTPRVLDLLEAAGQRATFFVVGRRAQRFPALVREMAARGHGVENHTWSHEHSFAFSSYRYVAREVDRAQQIVEELTGRAPGWFRAPAGITNPWVDPVLTRRGLSLVSWTRRGLDTVDVDVARITRRLVTGLGAGDILVLHDAPSFLGEGRCPGLEVLPRVLDRLRESGLRSERLPAPPAASRRQDPGGDRHGVW